VPIKGLGSPIEVFELIGAGAARTRLQAAAPRGLTRFVGRSAELEQLRDALDRANQGRGQVVAVVGEPGVGKSRLFWEFTHSHRLQGWLVLESASVSYGKATSYLPVIDLLRRYFKIQDRDEPREIREKVTGKLLTLDRALQPSLPALLALLDLPLDDAAWKALDPTQRRRRTLDALKQLLLREARDQALLLIFEDLHWIDGETQALLDNLVESLPAARVLLLVNFRPEYSHAWGSKTYYRQLRIDPLPPENADELLDALLGTDPALGPLKILLVERTDSNPLFLEEGVRALVDTGALAGERGAYRLTRPVEQLRMPATVQAILAARIDRLAPEAKRVLQAAAVIGKDVPIPLLLAIADAPEPEVRAELTRLQAAEFLYEVGLFPDLEYTFKHALTHEVTYGTLLQDRRKALHGRIVGAIARSYPDRLIEHVERLAHHAVGGELWDQAIAYSRQAGAKAVARSASREAVSYFEQALTALGHVPETRERLDLAIDVRFDLRIPLHALGEFERILGLLREAEDLARALDDQRRLGRLAASQCFHLWMTGHPREAIRFGENAHAIAESLRDVPLQVSGNIGLGAACLGAGNYRRAEEVLLSVLPLLDCDERRERIGHTSIPGVQARGYLTWAFADRGKFDQGIAHGQEGIRLAASLDQPPLLCFVHWRLACLEILKGEFNRAVSLIESGLALSRESNVTIFSMQNTGSLGYVYALSGRVSEGIPLLEHALSVSEAMRYGAVEPLFLLYLGEAYTRAERLRDALEVSGRLLTLTRERGQRGYEAWALWLHGEISTRHDPSTKSDLYYLDALALAEELGMCPLIAHCHLGLGKIHHRMCDAAQAQEHFTIATAMYREMGMTYWLEQAEAELRQLG
jgi:tetratricopeptide (TPR) repeat protein